MSTTVNRPGIFRCTTTRRVLQEAYGLVLADNLIRALLTKAAQQLQIPPIRISSVDSLERIRSAALRMATAPPHLLRAIFDDLIRSIAHCVLPKRKNCDNLRAVCKQSADHCYHGPITKQGNAHARWMLVQAAQRVRIPLGPLGDFFRKLPKKKNHKVAVVATARKLVVVAWHRLTKNEPYRYAQPKVTEEKLRRLRVRVTGERRKTGPKPGTSTESKLVSGVKTYTIKPLAQVYQEEGLPAIGPVPAGEAKALRRAAVSTYVASLRKPQAKKPKVKV